MQFTCTQEKLAKALQIVSRIVGTRGTLPVLGNILLSVEDGRLKVAATDLEVGIQTWVGGKAGEEGAITVPARLLTDFVQTNSDSQLELETKQLSLLLKSTKHQATIKGIDATEFPLMPNMKKDQQLSLPARELKVAITETVFATAIDETRPILTGVLLKIDDGVLKLVATDSYRLAERSVKLTKSTSPKQSLIVPARTLGELGRILPATEDDVTIYLSENQILFTYLETEMLSRLIDGTFPDYEQILPKKTTTTFRTGRQECSQVMKMASFFARESANNVQFEVDPVGGVTVSAVSPQLGDTVSKIDGKVTGDGLKIAFNAKFILDPLQIFPADEIEFSFCGPLQPGIIRPVDQDNYLYLIMPLRVES